MITFWKKHPPPQKKKHQKSIFAKCPWAKTKPQFFMLFFVGIWTQQQPNNQPKPKKTPEPPPCFFPGAWDFGLKLTQLWNNPLTRNLQFWGGKDWGMKECRAYRNPACGCEKTSTQTFQLENTRVQQVGNRTCKIVSYSRPWLCERPWFTKISC